MLTIHIYAFCKERTPAGNTNLQDRIKEIYYTQALIVILFTQACQNKQMIITCFRDQCVLCHVKPIQ